MHQWALIAFAVFALYGVLPADPGPTSQPSKQSLVSYQSWPALEQALEKAGQNALPLAFETLMQCPEYAAIVATGDLQYFLEMTRQRKESLVSLAGLLAIRHRYPEHIFEAAAAVCVHSPVSIANFAFLIEQLEAPQSDDKFARVMSTLMVSDSGEDENLRLAISLLNSDNLSRWFERCDVSNYALTPLSFVIECLYRAASGAGVPPTPKMRSALARLAQFEGAPSAIYVVHTTDRDESFVRTLKRVLADPVTTDRDVCETIMIHQGFIDSRIEIASLQLSPERRELVEKMLLKIRKNHARKGEGE